MKRIFSSILIITIIFSNSSTHAQTTKRFDNYRVKEVKKASIADNYDVEKRKRPQYEPYGKMLNAFRILPSIDFTTGYNDNIKSSKNTPIDSIFYQIDPTLKVETHLKRHQLNAFIGGNLSYFQQETTENNTGVFAGSDTRLDFSNDFNLAAGIDVIASNEKRSASDAQANGFSIEPIHYTAINLNSSANKRFNRLEISLGGFLRDLNYDDGQNISGQQIDQDDRDVVISGLLGQTTYELLPDYNVFGKTEWTERHYNIQTTNDRDSKGFRSAAGMGFALTNQITGEIYAGYMSRNYQHGSDISAPYYGGQLNWFPTPILSVYASADRDIHDSSFLGTNARITTDFNLRTAYELRRNIILTPTTGYELGSYKSINSEEKTMHIGSDVEYLINNNLSFVGSYRYIQREAVGSVLNFLDYKQNTFFITIQTKL